MTKRLRTKTVVTIKEENDTKKTKVNGRDQKAIMKKWWKEHRAANKKVLTEKIDLEHKCIQATQETVRAELMLQEKNVELDKLRLENEQLKMQIAQQQDTNEQVMQELVASKALVLDATNGMPFLQKDNNKLSMLEKIGAAILFFVNIIMFRTKNETRVKALKEVIFDKKIYGEVATEKVMKEMTRSYARKNIFLPWRVLRSIDLAINGGINYTGIEALRRVEDLQKHERGILPCRTSIQNCAAELHEVGQNTIPFEKVNCPLGEMYQFHYEKFIRHILKTFKLDIIAQRESIELCITLDGAELTKDLCHLSFGVKMTDPRAIDPRDGTPLAFSQEGVAGNIFKVQSRNYCFVMKTLLGKDSKEAYRYFADIFKFFENIRKDGLPANQFGPRIVPIAVWSPQDLSSIWKSLNTGCGARKTGRKHWCHLCACTGDTIARFSVGDNRCARCIDKGSEKCYHWVVGTEDSIQQFQQELTHQLAHYEQLTGINLAQVKTQSEMIYNPAEIGRYNNKYHIDFDPNSEHNDEMDILFFGSLLNKELRLRGLPLSGNMIDRQERLRQHLMIEERLDRIKEAIQRTEEGKEAALILIKQTIPCIMHIENRVGEKLITFLLVLGAMAFLSGRTGTSLENYVARIQKVVQTKILGTNTRPKQWRFPLTENGKEVSNP